ncbi:MAG: tyrosine-protein phosphatase [Acidimicrobiales bacterium]
MLGVGCSLSRHHLERRSTGMTKEGAKGVLSAPRAAMAGALDELDDRYGGIESYLAGPAGMTEETLIALRDNLVVSYD